jgi:CpcD/allophycocyanin linker domain
MKSLDTNTAITNFGTYNSHQFLIEFTGGNFTERLQGAATHKVIVPYGSLSKKLKTIQRLGSKVVNVSIHPQPEVLKVNLENTSTEPINEPILAVHHEISPKKSVEQPIAEILEPEVVEVAEITSEAFPEPILQTIPEITNQEVSDSNSEAVSAEVVTSKKKKAVSESTAKPKKPKASTKASNEVSKPESSTQVPEPIAIAEPITVPEQVLEPEPEIVVEVTVPTPPLTESPEPAPLPKAKAPRNSSKSGHGFNKSKSDAKSPRSPK